MRVLFWVKNVHTVALLQDLFGRGVVVSQWIARVAVLIQDVGVGDLVLEAPGDAHVRLWRVEASASGRADDLGSEGSQNIHLCRNTEQLGEKDSHVIVVHLEILP